MDVAFALASTNFVNVSCSKFAAPFTVLTRLPTRSDLFWYSVLTLFHVFLTFSSCFTNPLYPLHPQTKRMRTMAAITIKVRFLVPFMVVNFCGLEITHYSHSHLLKPVNCFFCR